MKKSILATALLLMSFEAQAKLQSVYTSVSKADCVTYDSDELQKEPEIDFYVGECPGLGGYQIIVSGGDLRYSIQLKIGDKVIPLSSYGAFHDLGSDKIEWQYERNDKGEVEYKTMIHTLSVATGVDEKDDKIVRITTKLDGKDSRVVGIIEN